MQNNLISNVISDFYWRAFGAGQFAWGVVIVLLIGTMLILANILRRKVKVFRRALMPTAVLAGLLALLIKEIVFAVTSVESLYVNRMIESYHYYNGERINVYRFTTTFGELFSSVLAGVIFHALPIAFIALMLRDKKDFIQEHTIGEKKARRAGALKSGSVLVSTYMLQAVIGLIVTIGLAFVIPQLLPGAGLFLPLGFGQGPPQAFAMGGIWNESTDSNLWQNFALTIAAFGFLFSSIPGVIMVNRIARKKGIERKKDEYTTVADMPPQQFEEPNEVPLSESIDKFTLQVCMVMGTYLLTIGLIFVLDILFRLSGINFLIDLIPTFWGFSFMIAMFVAFIVKAILRKLMKKKVMHRKYPNTYMMNRIAGLAFDVSIVCALMLISVVALGWLWIPAILMAALGGVGTAVWLRFITKRVYPNYKDEAFLAMYGLLTGTIACGTILSREIDPSFKTPATEDMVIGSAGAVALAFPLIILVPMAAVGNNFWWIFGVLLTYGMILGCLLLNVHKKIFKRKGKVSAERVLSIESEDSVENIKEE
ncbi:MAG: hypothetical protein FWE03_06565 [Firmicutes bacterium]|nr:hypothetical protein [Bacillota bacterium]